MQQQHKMFMDFSVTALSPATGPGHKALTKKKNYTLDFIIFVQHLKLEQRYHSLIGPPHVEEVAD